MLETHSTSHPPFCQLVFSRRISDFLSCQAGLSWNTWLESLSPGAFVCNQDLWDCNNRFLHRMAGLTSEVLTMPGQVPPVADEREGLLAYLAQQRYALR